MNLSATIAKMESCDFSPDQIVECLKCQKISEFVRRVMEFGASDEEMVDILESWAGNGGLPPRSTDGMRVYNTRPRDRRTKQGPLERWGYDGPITPMLSEKDWLPLRWKILQRDEFVCRYCGIQGQEAAQWCVDHVVPLSRGGTHDEDNLVACCVPCNNSKSDRLLSEWRGRYK